MLLQLLQISSNGFLGLVRCQGGFVASQHRILERVAGEIQLNQQVSSRWQQQLHRKPPNAIPGEVHDQMQLIGWRLGPSVTEDVLQKCCDVSVPNDDRQQTCSDCAITAAASSSTEQPVPDKMESISNDDSS